MRFVPALLLISIFAGCLADDEDPAQAVDDVIRDEADRFLVQEHDHFDASLHRASRNLEVVGYSNGVDDGGDPDDIPADMVHTELAVQGGYVYMARASGVDPTATVPLPICGEVPGNDPGRGGFSIIDVTNPAAPRVAGTYLAMGGADIEVDRTGDVVFFATQRNCITEIAGTLQVGQDPSDVLPRGIHIVDVSDKRAPELMSYLPLPINGPHTITYHDGPTGEFLIVSTYDLIQDPITSALRAAPVTQRVLIYEILRDTSGDELVLVPVNTFSLAEAGSGDRLVFPHDAIPYEHPTAGWLLNVAYWDEGLQLLDFNDPRAPLTVLDEYLDFSPSSRNSLHQVRSFAAPIGDLHVTVTEPEIISADETGQITFLDTTDPHDIRRLGHWTLPGDLVTTDFDFSPHNFDLADGKVFLAHNHAGLWVIDVGSEEKVQDPQSTGYFLDVRQRTDSPRFQPWFWGAFEDNGLIYTVDLASGLYVLRYTGP